MLDDRDFRPDPAPRLPLYRRDVVLHQRLGQIDNQLTDREPPSGVRLIVTLWGLCIVGVAFAVWRLCEALVGAAAGGLLQLLAVLS